MMKRLIAEIENEVMRRVWNAMDRSEPTKWRRTVAGRAPHRAILFRRVQNAPQMRPKWLKTVINGDFWAV